MGFRAWWRKWFGLPEMVKVRVEKKTLPIRGAVGRILMLDEVVDVGDGYYVILSETSPGWILEVHGNAVTCHEVPIGGLIWMLADVEIPGLHLECGYEYVWTGTEWKAADAYREPKETEWASLFSEK